MPGVKQTQTQRVWWILKCPDRASRLMAANEVCLAGIAEAVLDAGKADGSEVIANGIDRQVVDPAAPRLFLQPAPVTPHAESVLEVAAHLPGAQHPENGIESHCRPGRVRHVDGKEEPPAVLQHPVGLR